MPSFGDMLNQNLNRFRGEAQRLKTRVQSNMKSLKFLNRGGNPGGLTDNFPMIKDRLQSVRSRVGNLGLRGTSTDAGSARTAGDIDQDKVGNVIVV